MSSLLLIGKESIAIEGSLRPDARPRAARLPQEFDGGEDGEVAGARVVGMGPVLEGEAHHAEVALGLNLVYVARCVGVGHHLEFGLLRAQYLPSSGWLPH